MDAAYGRGLNSAQFEFTSSCCTIDIAMPSSRQPSPLRDPVDPEVAGAIAPGRVAVITGAASGIGKAAALELAQWAACCPPSNIV